MNIIELANQIMETAHKGQTRWDKKTPYIVHTNTVGQNARAAMQNYFDIWKAYQEFEISYPELQSKLGELSKTLDEIAGRYYLIAPNVIIDMVEAVGKQHDLIEDTNVTSYELRSYELNLSSDLIHPWNLVVDAVVAITKNPNKEETYLDYIMRTKANPISRLIKIFDIRHNLSDLKHGSMRDKYQLAEYILLN